MARVTRIQVTDDIDGTPYSEGEGETIRYAVEGVQYEIDLSANNASEFREALDPYIKVSRRVGGSSGGRSRGRGAASSDGQAVAAGKGSGEREYDPKQVRQWAQEHGVDVPARGRIPQKVIDQYKQAS